MSKSDTYCVLPHISMAIQNYSDFCCCNINKESWQTKEHEVMFAYKTPLKEAFKSPTRKMIADALDNNIKHPTCKHCWDLEKAGAPSARQQFNKIFGHLEPLPDQPRILIIKPGNTCNLACRMCNPATSSSWYRDAYQIENPGITFNEYTKTFETIRNSFNRDHEEFWTTLKEWIPKFDYIDIYGGDPFLIPAMFDLLEYGVEIGVSKEVAINITTNATIFNQRYIDILSKYRRVGFHVSIDSDIPAHMEYIRHGCKFDEVVTNIRKFKTFFKDMPHVWVSATYTLTSLNVFYADTAIANLNEMLGVEIIDANIVTTPEYDIRHLPLPVKAHLIQTIKSEQIRNFLRQQIPGCDVEWPKFCLITDKLDQLRGQSFEKTFPEWWEILKPHWGVYKY